MQPVAPAAAHVHLDPVAAAPAQHSLPHRGLLADEALQGVLPQGGHQLDFPGLAGVLHEDFHGVVQARRVGPGMVLNDPGSFDHPLEIADTAVVAVFFLLGALVLEVFAEIAEGPGGLHVLDELGAQSLDPVVDLLLHFLDVLSGQFVIHDGSSHSCARRRSPSGKRSMSMPA